jgi:hypothetical protein
LYLTTTERLGWQELEQPQVGPGGARRAGASESKGTEITEEVLFFRKLMHFMKHNFLFYNTHRDIIFLASIPMKILFIKLC